MAGYLTKAYFRKLMYPEAAINKFLSPPGTFFYLTKENALELGVEANFAE